MTRAELMRTYKAEGHTSKEVAEKFGVCVDYAKQICKGIAPQGYQPGYKKSDKDVASFIEERLSGFVYAGNYTGADGRVDIKCKTCGSVINRSMISVRHKNVKCSECEKLRLQEKERNKNIERDRRIRTAEVNRLNNAKQIRLVVCASCGKPFTAVDSRRRYCSKECLKRSTMSTQSSDDRLNKSNIIDRDITLEKLFVRDKGVCQICGGRCDYNDYHYNENGVFIAGEKYPSKDHIVELCNGGKHSWDNIRLAHRGCNSKLFWTRQRHSSRSA